VVRVCGWCGLFLGLKRPVDRWELTHGICRSCECKLDTALRPSPTVATPRMLVVSRDPIGLEAAGKLIARVGHSILVVADRRHSDRRWRRVRVPAEQRRADRRAAPPASWTDGYVLVEPVADPELAELQWL
jgi:hypothetical protein